MITMPTIQGETSDTLTLDNRTRTKREITLAHHEACTCGGAGPGEGCSACEMWHKLYPEQHGDPVPASGGGGMPDAKGAGVQAVLGAS